MDMATVLLAEYDRIKAEQMTRVGFRDNLLYATIATILTVSAAAGATKSPVLLLLIPLASVVLGWTYLANDQMVSAIGRYVRDDLDPRLAKLLDTQEGPLFGWEHNHRGDFRRVTRKRYQLAVDLLMFAIPSLVAVPVFWLTGQGSPALVAVSVAEIAITLMLARQIWIYADTNRSAVADNQEGR